MLCEKVLVQRSIVVKVVATCVGTAVEREPLMGISLFCNVLVALVAIVGWQTETHRTGPLGLVLSVTANAESSIEVFDSFSVAWVGELRLGMRIFCDLQFFCMARKASDLQSLGAGEAFLMTCGALELDLVMPMGCFTWQEDAFVVLLPGHLSREAKPDGAAQSDPDRDQEPFSSLHRAGARAQKK